MREILLKVGNSPQNIADYERYVASCIMKLVQELKKELDFDYRVAQSGGNIMDWKQDKTPFGYEDGLLVLLSLKKWKLKEKKE